MRKQTRAIVTVVRAARGAHAASFFLFAEDDMVLCPHGLHAVQYLLAKASSYAPEWIAIRARRARGARRAFAPSRARHPRAAPPSLARARAASG